MQFNKKAQGYRTVVGLILVLLIGGLLVGVVINWLGLFREAGDIQSCRLGLVAQTKTKVAGQTTFNVDCPVHEVTFHKDHVSLNVDGKKSKKEVNYEGEVKKNFPKLDSSGVDQQYDLVVDQTIADEMRKCWFKTGEGELQLFDEKLYKTEHVCMICSELDFSKEVREEYNYNGDLNYYLSTKYVASDNVTYAEYFKRPVFKKERIIPFVFDYQKTGQQYTFDHTKDIDPDKVYYLVYASKLPGRTAFSDDLKSYLGAEKGEHYMGGMYIVPQEDFGNLGCEVLVN